MAETRHRWLSLIRRARRLPSPDDAHSPNDCHFQDVMCIYDDEADDAIDKLNTLQDSNAPAGACSQRDDNFHSKEIVVPIHHDDSDAITEGMPLLEIRSDREAPLARPHSFEDSLPMCRVRSSSFSNQGVTTASENSGKMVRDPALPAVRALAEDTRTDSVSSIKYGSERSLTLGVDISMSAPVGIHFSEVQQQAAVEEVREFLKQKKYRRFFRNLLRAVKSNSEHAVKVMVDILRTFGYDLCEPQFREKKYTASILHVALLFKRDSICRLLIETFPSLVRVKYTSEKFRNQTAIHIVASNGQCEILEDMLSAVSKETGTDLINTVADGTYFKDFHPEGALALSAAAWNGYPEMLGMLIDKGADLDIRGPMGNTVLHYIVKLSTKYPQSNIPKELFDVVWEKCVTWWSRHQQETKQNQVFDLGNKGKMLQIEAFRYLLLLRNYADQNILSLSVNLHSNLTMRILHIEHVYKQPQTKFGAITWSTFDVTDVTSYFPRDSSTINRYNPGSVLHILAHRAKVVTTEEDADYNDLIEEEPILTVVKMKWSTYRWVYVIWCFVHLGLMLGLSVVSIGYSHEELHSLHGTANKTEVFLPKNTTSASYNQTAMIETSARKVYLSYLPFAVVPLVYLILEVVDIFSTGYRSMKSLNPGIGKVPSIFRSYLLTQLSITGNAPYRLCGFLFSVSVLAWLGLHLLGDDFQDIPLSLSMVFGWSFMLLFTRCCRHICRFSIMMQKMFFQDCLYFLAVYIFFLLAFSTAIHVLVLYGENKHVSVWTTLYGMLNIVTDAGDKASGEAARIPGIGGALLSIYAVVSVILLINMLIAMMNTSYDAVKSSQTNIWRHQQLSVMLLIERRFWWWAWLCERSQNKTWSPKKQTRPRLYLEITEKSWQQPTEKTK